MKNILVCFFVFWRISGLAQAGKPQAKPDTSGLSPYIQFNSTNKPPPVNTKYRSYKNRRPLAVTLIDSVNVFVPYIKYIDPNEVSHVNIIKDKKYPNGAMYIDLKNHKLLLKLLNSKLLSLHDIVNTYVSKK
jgi:hypothetical protein